MTHQVSTSSLLQGLASDSDNGNESFGLVQSQVQSFQLQSDRGAHLERPPVVKVCTTSRAQDAGTSQAKPVTYVPAAGSRTLHELAARINLVCKQHTSRLVFQCKVLSIQAEVLVLRKVGACLAF